MCRTCGCDGARGHEHPDHRLAPDRARREVAPRTLRLEVDLLEKNDRLARRNRALFSRLGVLALNVMGTPGAGKTALLEATLSRLAGELPLAVLEGDQETDNDAARIRKTGCPVLQINTGAGCHLDATMLLDALEVLHLEERSLLIIENVGNLVCPALFDLGERAKVVVMSTTEGEDKPLKYPHMVRAADVLVLNKIDLAPHVGFEEDAWRTNVARVNPTLRVFTASATRGDGVEEWCAWLRAELAARPGHSGAAVA